MTTQPRRRWKRADKQTKGNKEHAQRTSGWNFEASKGRDPRTFLRTTPPKSPNCFAFRSSESTCTGTAGQRPVPGPTGPNSPFWEKSPVFRGVNRSTPKTSLVTAETGRRKRSMCHVGRKSGGLKNHPTMLTRLSWCLAGKVENAPRKSWTCKKGHSGDMAVETWLWVMAPGCLG